MATCPDSEGVLGGAQSSTPSNQGPGEKFKVLADGGQLYSLIVQPHNVLEMCDFLCVVGDMSGHPSQETILLEYGYLGRVRGEVKS